jgi:hypothetical protein
MVTSNTLDSTLARTTQAVQDKIRRKHLDTLYRLGDVTAGVESTMAVEAEQPEQFDEFTGPMDDPAPRPARRERLHETAVTYDADGILIPLMVEYRWVRRDRPDGSPGYGEEPEAVRCYIPGGHDVAACKQIAEQIDLNCREIESAMERIGAGGHD